MSKPSATRLRVDGLSTRVYSAAENSPAHGPTFILVHGIGMSHRCFRRLQEKLSEVGKVHSIDLPGYGSNRMPRRNCSVEDHATILASALDNLGEQSCVLVGHSMGSEVVVELAVQRPDLVSRLVLIGPVVDQISRSAGAQAARLTADTFLEPPTINALVALDYLRCGLVWYLRQLRPMLEYRIEDRIVHVTCPTLVIRGADDPIAPEPWCKTLASLTVDGSSVSIPGGAHVIQHNRTDEVASAVFQFAAQQTDVAR